MEASDTSGQEPTQEPGQSDATGQDQSQGEQPAQSQEQPQDDSQLTTPQPDQPAPSEAERQQSDDSQVSQPESVGGSTTSAGPSGEPAEGTVSSPPQFPSSAQQESAAVDREQELEADRRSHNARTGGGEIQPNEVQDARQTHNDRTGGGQIPGTSEPVQESEPQEQPES